MNTETEDILSSYVCTIISGALTINTLCTFQQLSLSHFPYLPGIFPPPVNKLD